MLVNILYCGIIGVVTGVILRNITSSHLLSIILTTLCAEGIGLTVNISLIKENKCLKEFLKQEQEETDNSEEKLETPNLEEEKVQIISEQRSYRIREYDGYRREPIWTQPENDSVYYDDELHNQVQVPSRSLEELIEKFELTQEPFEKGVTRTLELPK